MNKYTPDSWAILRMTTPKETIYKVLCSYYGGYTTGDSWKVSSGITDVIVHNNLEGVNYYELPQYSGSTYICLKNSEHISVIMAMMLSSWQEQVKDKEGTSIKVMNMDKFLDEWCRNESY